MRRIVYSSSDSDSDSGSEGLLPKIETARPGDNANDDDGVIEITDSSEEDNDGHPSGLKQPAAASARIGVALVSLPPPMPEHSRDPFDDGDGDDGLLVL